MKVFKSISRVNPTSIWQLLKLGIGNMLFLWPTYLATKECMELATKHFGRKHYQNGPSNAFRHAFWNILIAKRCFQIVADTRRVLDWAKEITDWHERAFFSKKLPMKMDYHNNAVGRMLFEKNLNWSQVQFLEALLELTENAIKITENEDFNQCKNQLVYIRDDH